MLFNVVKADNKSLPMRDLCGRIIKAPILNKRLTGTLFAGTDSALIAETAIEANGHAAPSEAYRITVEKKKERE